MKNRGTHIAMLIEGIITCLILLTVIIASELFNSTLANTLLHNNLFYIVLVLIPTVTLLVPLAIGRRK